MIKKKKIFLIFINNNSSISRLYIKNYQFYLKKNNKLFLFRSVISGATTEITEMKTRHNNLFRYLFGFNLVRHVVWIAHGLSRTVVRTTTYFLNSADIAAIWHRPLSVWPYGNTVGRASRTGGRRATAATPCYTECGRYPTATTTSDDDDADHVSLRTYGRSYIAIAAVLVILLSATIGSRVK